MFHEAIQNLLTCNSGICFAWHGTLGLGALLLGLWLAFELWCRPFREEAGIYMSVLRDRERLREERERGELSGGENGAPIVGASSGRESAALLQAADRARRQRQADGVPDPSVPWGWKAVELASPQGEPADSGALGGSADPAALTPAKLAVRPNPSTEDDLTLIEGISARLRNELRALGVNRFERIASWSPDEVAAISEELGVGEEIERLAWISQARELTMIFSEEAVDGASAFWAGNGEEGTTFSGDALRRDENLGFVFVRPPEVRDDLTQVVTLSRAAERELGKLGIFRFRQISRWSPANVKAVEERLGLGPGFITQGRWRQQAERRHREIYRGSDTWTVSSPPRSEYESRIAEAYGGAQGGAFLKLPLGIVYRTPPAGADDLTRIPGIGELVAVWLRDCGVYRFRQIADWSMDNVRAFAGRLDLPVERILQEGWIGKAAALADEVEPLHFPAVRRKLRA